MIINFHKSFHKQATKLKPAQKKRLGQALMLFQDDPYYPSLNNHTLTGEWQGHQSISFGGDWRAHYKVVGNEVIFVACGTHAQLYK